MHHVRYVVHNTSVKSEISHKYFICSSVLFLSFYIPGIGLMTANKWPKHVADILDINFLKPSGFFTCHMV